MKWFIPFIEPIGGEITVAHESGMVGTTSKTSMEKALDQQLRNCKFSDPGDKSQKRGCYYTSIPHVVKDKGVHGQELTALNLDKVTLSCMTCEASLQHDNVLTLVFADMGNWYIDLPDTIVRKDTDERLWRFWRPTSWRATIFFHCIFGMYNWYDMLLFSITLFDLYNNKKGLADGTITGSIYSVEIFS